MVEYFNHSTAMTNTTPESSQTPPSIPNPPGGGNGDQHVQVREAYARAAQSAGGSDAKRATLAVGYSDADISQAGDSANLGLACGNPQAIADIVAGEVVLDLGSGAGFDALLVAPKLGASGRFIGVDMTPAMLERARINSVNAGCAGIVEFREGLIEALPVGSATVDVAISNCVINLSPDKPQVFSEIFRVLKPGGRIAISDIALDRPLPSELAESGDAWNACLGGAVTWSEYEAIIKAAGFEDVRHTRVSAASLLSSCGSDPLTQQLIASAEPEMLRQAMDSVYSYSITARKP